MYRPVSRDLPSHIEARVDAHSGRTYFLDHRAHTSSWVDPREAKIKPHTFEECEGPELPYGWEMAVDPEVGLYYIDHNTWSTQLEDPRLPPDRRRTRRATQRHAAPPYGRHDASTRRPGPGSQRQNHPAQHARYASQRGHQPSSSIRMPNGPAPPSPGNTQRARLQQALTAAKQRVESLRTQQHKPNDAHFEGELVDAMREVTRLRRELALLKRRDDGQSSPEHAGEVEARAPIRSLASFGALPDSHEVESVADSWQTAAQHAAEKEELRRNLLQRNLEARQDQTAAELRLEMLRMELERERRQNQASSADLLQELQRLRMPDTSHLEAQQQQFLALLEAQRQREEQLKSQLAALENELHALRNKETPDFITQQALEARLKSIDEEYVAELEAATQVFMPQSKINEAFHRQAAEIDALRRQVEKLLQQGLGSQHRRWDENLQTFVELGDGGQASDEDGASSTGITAAHRRPRAATVSAPSNKRELVKRHSVDVGNLWRSRAGSANARQSMLSPATGGTALHHQLSTDGSRSRPNSVSSAGPLATATASRPTSQAPTPPVPTGEMDSETRRLQAHLDSETVAANRRLERLRLEMSLKRGITSLPSTADLAYMLRQGRFRRVELDEKALTEEWMHDAHLMQLLQLEQKSHDNLATKRAELQERVARLRTKQQQDPEDLTFTDKVALLELGSHSPATENPHAYRRGSYATVEDRQQRSVPGSMGVKYDQSVC